VQPAWLLPSFIGGLSLATAGGALFWVRARVARRPDPARLARGLAKKLDPSERDEETARIITDGFIAFLHAACERPAGALTPSEAAEHIAALTGQIPLAERTRALIAACDRSRFATGGDSATDSSALVAEARGLFEALAAIVAQPRDDAASNDVASGIAS
jgi:hypothetical protein